MGSKREECECEEGEAWLASFADLLSLLLGFFILLYSLSVMDERKFYEMGKSISSSFQSSDEDGTQEEAVALKTKAKQIKAYQMLVAILNLGDENTAGAAGAEDGRQLTAKA